ncbi:MAG: DNA translocase FtsK [Planctomycetes bacterium]|nr:DNA translocase FtsK [Planctomycetota bacterium]MBI3833680.1 DNA translocase FtsK [Planctomycetota bacterium]
MTADRPTLRPRKLTLPLMGLAAAALLWPAMFTFHLGDWPSPHQFPHNDPTANACGVIGAWCVYYLRYFLGDGAYILLLFCTLAALLKIARGEIRCVGERAFGLLLVLACTSASAHLIATPSANSMPVGNGGVIGYALGELLTRNLSKLGTTIVLVASWVVGLIFATQGWVLKIPSLMGRAAQASRETAAVAANLASAAADAVRGRVPALKSANAGTPNATASKSPSEKLRTAGQTSDAKSSPYDKGSRENDESPARKESNPREKIDAGDSSKTQSLFDPATPATSTSSSSAAAKSDDSTPTTKASAPAGATNPASWTSTPATARPNQAARPASLPIVHFSSPQRVAAAEPYPKQIENWRLPDLSLLNEAEYNFSAQQEAVVRRQAKILEETLAEFRVDAQVVEIDTGPVITMFELKLGSGIKVSQIAALSNDIARALKAHAIRVVAPISGKNTVGIEVPNVDKEKVRLRELMSLSGQKASAMSLPLFLGKDAGGQPLIGDLASMPHMLIAGTTGSGKSVCLNSIILSLLMTKRPDHVKMILIDPKMVEMSQFKDVPHLMCPLVTDMARAEKILEWAVTQMDERYELLAEARVKNIAGYNALGESEIIARFAPATEEEKAQIPMHLPFVVIVIDELADLMMTAAKEVEHHLSRLAQKSRAVGIHIIVATQRPEVKVVTGLIKSNLPARVCFRVASRMDSRIVLDQNGGEVLMGQGDMLFLPPGSHKLLRAQGTYLGDSEVQAVLEDLASRAKPEFHPELMKLKASDSDEADPSMRDPLFDDGVRIILESRRGSVSLLQRRLTIGYSRASRLIDQMASAGIVGEYKGSQAREVLMTLDDWNRLKSQVDDDLKAGYEADEDSLQSQS